MKTIPLAALLGLGFAELMILLIILCSFSFWIWMLVDCATKEEDKTQKIVWVIIIAVTGIVGAPLYFFVRKLRRKS